MVQYFHIHNGAVGSPAPGQEFLRPRDLSPFSEHTFERIVLIIACFVNELVLIYDTTLGGGLMSTTKLAMARLLARRESQLQTNKGKIIFTSAPAKESVPGDRRLWPGSTQGLTLGGLAGVNPGSKWLP